MKTLLKLLAFALIAAAAFFAFFPSERIRDEMGKALGARIAESGADIKWDSLESDFIRTVTLEDVVLTGVPGLDEPLRFERLTLSFPFLFLLRKSPAPVRASLGGSAISVTIPQIEEIFSSFSGAGRDIELPPLIFRRVRVTSDELRRTFIFGGRLDDGHIRVQVRSGRFNASSRADRESSGLWRMRASVRNMDFFSLFLSSPVLSGENFSGSFGAALRGGKIEDTEISGLVTADSAIFTGISFYDGEVFELKEIQSRLSVANDIAEFSGSSAEYGQLRLSGGLKIASLSEDPLSDGSFKVSGKLHKGDFSFDGLDALLDMGGFLSAPVLRASLSAASFEISGIELKGLSAAASFNERNSGRLSINSFNAKYGALDVSGEGSFEGREFAGKGLIEGLFESDSGILKIEAPYELARSFKVFPEIELSSYGREVKLKGELSYSPSDAAATLRLEDVDGANVLSAKLLRSDEGFDLEEAELMADAPGRLFFSGGLIQPHPGGFSFISSFDSDLSFFKDSGKFSLSYSPSSLELVLEGKDNLLKYGHKAIRKKTTFALEGQVDAAVFEAGGVYDSGNLKGNLSLGDFRSDFELSAGILRLRSITAGEYVSANLTFAESVSGEIFLKDYPLRVKALGKDEKVSGAVKIADGKFEAEFKGESFAEKISGELSLSGISEFRISVEDSVATAGAAKESDVRVNSLSGDFRLLLSDLRPRELVIARARIREGSGRADFSAFSWDISAGRAAGRVQIRNIKRGFVDIFANSDFEIEHSSGFRIKGKAEDVFLNAFYAPFEYDVLISSESTVFARPEGAPNGIEGVLSSAGGKWEIFTSGRRLSLLWDSQGIWELETPGLGLQSILKLFNTEIEAFGDVAMSASGSKDGYKLSFDAPDIYVGAKLSASGSFSYDGDFFYPDVLVSAAAGFIKTEGYMAAAPGQVNSLSVKAENLKIPVIYIPFGEIRNFAASGQLRAGGTYEMPVLEGEILSSFRLKHRDYPENVDFALTARAVGDKISLSSDGSVKGTAFRLTGDAQLASGGLKNYSLFLQLPEKGVPVVVPGLLIERRRALRYILGTTPSRGKIAGYLRLADDGEQVSVEGQLKIKDARFSYKQDRWGGSRGPVPNMDVTLVFERNVEWISDNFKADIYGSINIKGAPYEVNGKISSNRGRLTYLGKNLDVDFAEIDIVKNKIFLTLQAEAAVSRTSPNPPFDTIQDTIRVDIRHSPLDSLDINLASKDYSDNTTSEQAYQMITGVPAAAPGDLEFMRREIAKVIDSSIINPIFSELVRDTGIIDEVRLDVSALAARSASSDKLDGLDVPESINLYMGKSFGRMYLGYNMEFMRDISSLQLFSGFEVIYRIKGDNILRAVYQPEGNGESRRYLGVERRIRF